MCIRDRFETYISVCPIPEEAGTVSKTIAEYVVIPIWKRSFNCDTVVNPEIVTYSWSLKVCFGKILTFTLSPPIFSNMALENMFSVIFLIFTISLPLTEETCADTPPPSSKDSNFKVSFTL